ncbi:YgjP-like metallopeptidase domain-containing protein [Desulfogranum marinum]|uniref:YgjP-like metallopeptidase domain-containing protein n=1 Tax=Desulfogranum marinum TaxID=453220 RepID=UPI0029C7D90F|nr:YgjP-like metallopeptidase domain-containing protein [Desulfogranum marinum]
MTSFEYRVIRRPRRKTASISVKPDCTVQVIVPATLSEQKVTELVERKRQWIRRKLDHFREIKKKDKEKQYVSGESFAYLGRNYRLKVVDGSGSVKLSSGRFYVYIPSSIKGGPA